MEKIQDSDIIEYWRGGGATGTATLEDSLAVSHKAKPSLNI